MKHLRSVKDLKRWRLSVSDNIGFVPTMGALHDGHLSLIRKSKENNDKTVVSIFLNPTQFDNTSDLENYPASLEEDLEKLRSVDIEAVWAPKFEDLYPDNYRYSITEKDLSLKLCGEHRPGHFDGVLTVVMKLFNLVRPKRAYFGEKDYQQMLLIQKMNDAFFLDIEIIPCPIVRESSGLAMSSRNKRLSQKGQKQASHLYQVIKNAQNSAEANQKLKESGFNVEYIEEMDGRRLAAVELEGIRLIDNVSI